MRYLLSRFGFYLLAFVAAVTINFFLPRLMPGDPIQSFLGRLAQNGGQITPETIASLEALYGYSTNTPLFQQFLTYLQSIMTGEWGTSTRFFQPVFDVLGRGMLWTLLLVGSYLVVSYTITTLLGIWVAWKRGTWVDSVITVGSVVISSIPAVVMALLMYFIFASDLGWFPTSYAYDPSLDPAMSFEFVSSVAYHLALPLFSMVLLGMGNVMGMRSNMINQLGEDFIVMGWAKGVKDKKVMLQYGARNAVLPMITTFAMSVGAIFAGSLIIEIIFNYPGLGQVMFQAMLARDYPLIQGYLLIMTIMVLGANFIADLLLFVLDPRLRTELG
ncbi:ABC transporter permease [Vibrio mediterranei]|jgi:peptide/nickel transport system permease protein|uniref:ABC transporter permease n=2 Tax=Vibrio TaxID=662 RepID=A0ABX5DE89_9VIBR|nr:ABC transporter permease [Vibrio mediterranei]MCG9662880.1 ABC transporter permease [Vibrio mediterranei]PCD88513.1 ABC transporter permease [Vibrio mediterranei]PRQ66621.1 ABC transporter permease [Vibrio mediterranei]PTC05435.1 ABC transporter permease [Vibrio mediterranei]SBO07929.1 Nickel transport system permease protein NikB [Vibrio mediterranei]